MNKLHNFDVNFADKVASLCFKKFASLPKSGKPVLEKEWTLLAAIVKRVDDILQVVSIATGSKCIGSCKMNCDGNVINDSHAEVLARRGFIRYLLEEIRSLRQNGKSSIFILHESNECRLRDNVTFHLLTSHVPCGDASIFPKFSQEIDLNTSSDNFSNSCIPSAEDEKIVKKFKSTECRVDDVRSESVGDVVTDIYRTGAKCLPHDIKQDEKQPGVGYHIVGVVRTKPGRGDPTLSVSCSDKILRWNCVGIEGALLSMFLLQPIRLSSIIVASHPSLYCNDAMRRAVIERNESVRKLCINPPHLLHSSVEFEFSKRKSEPHTKPAPCSIVWCDIIGKNHEVYVEGRRLGWTKKKKDSPEPLLIAKKHFLSIFKSLTSDKYTNLNYLQVKQQAKRYRELSKEFKNSVGIWTVKNDDLLSFM